jgi:DNA-binding IclR family transcriptional regulator
MLHPNQDRSTMDIPKGAVSRALAILKCLVAEKAGTRIQTLASKTGLNISTTHRILQTLVSERMVAFDPDTRCYSIGTECVRLAAGALGEGSLVSRISEIAKVTAMALGETCAFYKYEPDSQGMMVTVVEHGPNALGYNYEIGDRGPVYAGASGKAILAFLAGNVIDSILKKPLTPLTEATIVDPAQLRQELEKIRRVGYAISKAERAPHGTGFAVPVILKSGSVVGSVGLSIPFFRFREDRLADSADMLHDSARQIATVFDIHSHEADQRDEHE